MCTRHFQMVRCGDSGRGGGAIGRDAMSCPSCWPLSLPCPAAERADGYAGLHTVPALRCNRRKMIRSLPSALNQNGALQPGISVHQCVAVAVVGHHGEEVLPAGVAHQQKLVPIGRIRAGLAAIPSPLPGTDALAVARGIMTTDTVHKIAEATIGSGPARVVGVAKGVGMIEPNMATLITMAFTDANVEGDALDAIWRRVIDRTFNCVSIDTDTSTSDTAIVLASGAAGSVDLAELEVALEQVTQSLTKQVARDGEGAETLIEVCVDQARDGEQAKTVAKAIVNSPLVKTAVHGADPNWGRVAMAVGKCSQYTDIDQNKVIIRFGDQEVYPVAVDESGLQRLSEYMRGDEVRIHVSLQTGQAASTVWGCDLTDGYVRINADYTT